MIIFDNNTYFSEGLYSSQIANDNSMIKYSAPIVVSSPVSYVEHLNIPKWAKRITLIYTDVTITTSTSSMIGPEAPVIMLYNSSGVTSTNYNFITRGTVSGASSLLLRYIDSSGGYNGTPFPGTNGGIGGLLKRGFMLTPGGINLSSINIPTIKIDIEKTNTTFYTIEGRVLDSANNLSIITGSVYIDGELDKIVLSTQGAILGGYTTSFTTGTFNISWE